VVFQPLAETSSTYYFCYLYIDIAWHGYDPLLLYTVSLSVHNKISIYGNAGNSIIIIVDIITIINQSISFMCYI
jgi:hypothetical protein